MSYRARQVIRAIDLVDTARERHPTLLAAQLRNDRSCLSLARALERYSAHREPSAGRLERDEVERVDADIENLYAERRRERFEKRSIDFANQRRNERAQLAATHSGLVELHHRAIARAAAISTVKAGNVEPSRSTHDSTEPASQQLLDDDPRYRAHWQVMRRALLHLHALLDEAEGHGAVAETTMSREEKNRLILAPEMAGMSPLGVYDLLGAQVAGSPETVRRVRRFTQLRDPEHQRQLLGFLHDPVTTSDGRPMPDAGRDH